MTNRTNKYTILVYDVNNQQIPLDGLRIDFRNNDLVDIPVIYPSLEDNKMYYKSYIEDVILSLEMKGVTVIPDYKYLRAHDNKVFMEILRDLSTLDELKTIKSYHFGTFEEFIGRQDEFNVNRYVIKLSRGAMSSGVELSENKEDLLSKIEKISSSKEFSVDLKDRLRALKHKGYIQNSTHQQKYIIQDFIPNLTNDWKIIIFGDRYYVVYRETRENDFRASGSGKLKLNDELIIPDGMLDYAKKVFESFNVPRLSLDVMFDGKSFHVVEFQFVAFGTSSHSRSDSYFKLLGDKWDRVYEQLDLEKIYVESIVKFLEK